MWVMCSAPLIAILFLGGVFYLAVACADRLDMRDDDTSRVRRSIRKAQFMRLSLFTLFLLYPGLCSRAIR